MFIIHLQNALYAYSFNRSIMLSKSNEMGSREFPRKKNFTLPSVTDRER